MPSHPSTLYLTRALLVLCALLQGCASYNAKVEAVVSRYESGDFQGAAEDIHTGKFDQGFESDKDGVLFLLEGAKILQDAGQYDESAALFERASARLEHFDMQADVSISEEFLATIGSQTSRDYRGTDYDRILLEVYQVFNELGRGDLSEALVRVRRAYRRQAEAVANNRREIAAREEEGNHAGDAALASGEYGAYEQSIQSLTSESYADFVNPLATFLSAVLLREEGSAENSRVDLRKLIGLQPNNTFLPELLQEFEAGDAPVTDRFYVIFENGMAPKREEWSILLPTPNGLTRFAMPTLSPQPRSVDSLHVRADESGMALNTQLIASVDSIVAADFAANMATMVWRIVASGVAKEVASHAIRQNDNNDLLRVAFDIFKIVSAAADLRTWRTLGSEFQIAYGQVPAEGQLVLGYSTGSQGAAAPVTLEVPSARTTIILVRNPRFSPIVPHVFSIGRGSRRVPAEEAPAPDPTPELQDVEPAAPDPSGE